MVVNVTGDPFFITSPNGGETLNAGCTDTATWTVGGGSIAPNANLLLSTDSGLTFPTALASSVPNDGSEDFTVPCIAAAAARMRAEGDGNIFFDISDGDFTIAANAPEVAFDGPEFPEGEFDENCEYLMQFSATVTDQCSVSAASVNVEFSVFGDAATITDGTFEAAQVDAATVSVTGSALVSDLTSNLAIARALVTVADGCGFEEQDPYDVTIFDNIPPTIDVTLDPDAIWPPNHRMRTITANVVALDNCPISGFELLSVTSDEPDEGTGDGDFPNDIPAPSAQGAETDGRIPSPIKLKTAPEIPPRVRPRWTWRTINSQPEIRSRTSTTGRQPTGTASIGNRLTSHPAKWVWRGRGCSLGAASRLGDACQLGPR
jgi:hypothetical protein